MGYMKAEEILPMELIELIQQYVDGRNIYIPRKEENRQEWGTGTQTRQQLQRRNQEIYEQFNAGICIAKLAEAYFLSEKSIQRILRNMRR